MDKEATKVCTMCGPQPVSEFYKRRRDDLLGLATYCKRCVGLRGRNNTLFTFYRITSEEYDQILKSQGGKCAVCRRTRKNGHKHLAVDHNHKTGLIRGVLCWHCNRSLGLLKDSLINVLFLAEYLTDPPAVRVLGKRYGLVGKALRKKKMVYGGPEFDEKDLSTNNPEWFAKAAEYLRRHENLVKGATECSETTANS